MKKALVILIILTLLFGGCQTKREVKESNTFHKLIPNFQYFQMIDRNNGWAIGENMGENKVFITNDGGTTWVTALTSAIGDIREWFFMDSDHAWILYSNETLYKTEDRGKNWDADEVPFGMGKLFFINSGGEYQGWALKEYGPASGNVPVDVYKLINNKWTLIHEGELPNSTSASPNPLPYEGEKKSFVFLPDVKTGFITVERCEPGKSSLYMTTDGRYTWNKKIIPLLSRFDEEYISVYSLKLVDGEIIWPISAFDDVRGDFEEVFLVSKDNGNSWKEKASFVSKNSPREVYVVDEENWYVLFEDELFKTNNGGNTWEKLNIPQGTFQIQFIDNKTVWALASTSGGTNLFYSENGGYTWDKKF
ncbi:hypothetical protein SAMN04244560_01536 [Thermoanaerobacter thermohydrosulfuricus]|uniref:Photosynthesis system II assembly factor Ycf48/Hcf136-like domain-containing protein n=2 Tax=Thermoanaerobacter thermohydrosulfuricus TaxID=1516 RepID=M8DPQ0_THETY|nr:hypothetical protein [Thermoanaerobacter thermohydrosulfuricus]EMT38516.1 hypothetical protein TthWC1_1940 [Thermoanaerobacter thermohydrosulfuricus WC1]SDF95617.1 hypothetical protein SAMN04244560_01536 [Thermoanaerobacter thermohydrosulfuricus]SFE65829.1 hypothetical protein SAMN04324257_02442 [Thermoanaerobacter thermohydrosulfuricus]